MEILIKGLEMPKDDALSVIIYPDGVAEVQIGWNGDIPVYTNAFKATAIPVPEHNDLADKSVIIERMGNAQDELWDKVDEKALSECHVAFLKAVMYAPTVLEASNG